MSHSYFGTDGIRGCVGQEPMTADFILHLGWAIGTVLGQSSRVVLGQDTRFSSDLLQFALQAGLIAAGCNVLLAGMMPTPAIAYLNRTFRGDLGIVISASHNPYNDNGIKLFSMAGFKVDDAFIKAINETLNQPVTTKTAKNLGQVFPIQDVNGRYIEFCKSAVPHQTNFRGLSLVLDCANGSTTYLAPPIFRELGAHVITIGAQPNGFNINQNCGAMHPETVRKSVLSHQADLGIAFDGDGDRVIMVDHEGGILDGDDILFIIAKSLLKNGLLSGGVVGTIMSNTGLERALEGLKIPFRRTAVGDQHIAEKLIEEGWQLGGEPSGHILSLRSNTTGDGMIAALHVLHAMTTSGCSLHQLRSLLEKYPMAMANVKTMGESIDLESIDIKTLVKRAEKALGTNGRVIIRKSGTEPLVRIMVEGKDENVVHHELQQLQNYLERQVMVGGKK